MSTTTTTATGTTPSTELPTTKWADTPFALIPTPLPKGQKQYKTDQSSIHYAYIMAHDMSHLHNMILRLLNSIWQQAPHVQSEQDIKDFLQFCKLWCTHLHHHHDTEETVFFPAIEDLVGTPGCMEPNVEQHRAFESGLARLEQYSESTTPATYSPGALRAIITSFGHVLTTHLTDEIDTLLKLQEYDSDKLKAIWKKSGDYARGAGEKSEELPLLVGAYDVDYEGGSFSEFNLPLPVYWLVEWVFYRKYAGSWRFLPCDGRSHRRELQFGPKAV